MTLDVRIQARSRAEEAGYLALADIALVAARYDVDHRMVGGQMVTLHVAASGAIEPVLRETADADLGVDSLTAANPLLPRALRDIEYETADAANRFERLDSSDRLLAIDVLALAPSRALRPNRQHGDLVVDEIPGLLLALSGPATEFAVVVTMLDGTTLAVPVALPDLLAALCLKLMSWASRRAKRDAVDVWRLLRSMRAALAEPPVWGDRGTQRDAVAVLRADFARPVGPGRRAATDQPAEQAEIRALTLWVLTKAPMPS